MGSQAGFPGKQTRSPLGINIHPQKGRERARLDKVRSAIDIQSQQSPLSVSGGDLELGMAFQSPYTGGERAEPLYLCANQSLSCGCLWKQEWTWVRQSSSPESIFMRAYSWGSSPSSRLYKSWGGPGKKVIETTTVCVCTPYLHLCVRSESSCSRILVSLSFCGSHVIGRFLKGKSYSTASHLMSRLNGPSSVFLLHYHSRCPSPQLEPLLVLVSYLPMWSILLSSKHLSPWLPCWL